MKKVVLILSLLVAFGLSARAQITVGGDLSFNRNFRDKVTSLRISPDIGYSIDDFFIGATLNFEHYKNDAEGQWERNVGITPYVDYYFWSVEPLSAFAEAGCGVTAVSSAGEPTLLNWAPYVSLGFQVDLTEHWCVELYVATLEFSELYRELDCSLLGNGFSAGLYYTF